MCVSLFTLMVFHVSTQKVGTFVGASSRWAEWGVCVFCLHDALFTFFMSQFTFVIDYTLLRLHFSCQNSHSDTKGGYLRE